VFKLVTLVVFPLLPLFVLWREEHELQRKAKTLDQWTSFFFQVNKFTNCPLMIIIFLIMVVLCSWLFCVQVHHPYDVLLLPFFVVEEKAWVIKKNYKIIEARTKPNLLPLLSFFKWTNSLLTLLSFFSITWSFSIHGHFVLCATTMIMKFNVPPSSSFLNE
jgi:hypothetical protein